jgi:hypothetical protein
MHALPVGQPNLFFRWRRRQAIFFVCCVLFVVRRHSVRVATPKFP